LPFTVNVFNSKKQNKTVITLEVEVNQSCNLSFKSLQMVHILVNMGDKPVDIEIVKRVPTHELNQD